MIKLHKANIRLLSVTSKTHLCYGKEDPTALFKPLQQLQNRSYYTLYIDSYRRKFMLNLQILDFDQWYYFLKTLQRIREFGSSLAPVSIGVEVKYEKGHCLLRKSEIIEEIAQRMWELEEINSAFSSAISEKSVG
ncbi:MAG: hypothetical protein QW231_02055 [Candidatus Bathyarchaeia archaeon]